ncbi:MAG: 4'-phosphopantetheinyl transferase superfamily protein [Chitinophagales bacterium]|nr:4'-phosphopantetheinyl transferase superfamily protein [Chitinophagales bacterium]
MPLHFRKTTPDFDLAVWKITEQESFFESSLRAPENIPNPKVRLQWYATRHLVNVLTGKPSEILKDEFGKPYLQDNISHISLTHTANFAAAIVSTKYEAGIDLEAVLPRVERIAHKFLREDERNAIRDHERVEKLILYWSAKEALYKLHGRKQLDFTTQLLIAPFDMQTEGALSAEIVADGFREQVKVHYTFFEQHLLTYVTGR